MIKLKEQHQLDLHYVPPGVFEGITYNYKLTDADVASR